MAKQQGRATLVSVFGVGAILHTSDGRYLMQLRDDRPTVSMRNCWGLFGGVVEPHESPEQALLRELKEELSFAPSAIPTRFTDVRYSLDFAGHGIHRKAYYPLAIVESDVVAMRIGEGQEMRLFSLGELLVQPNVLPWDLFGLFMFAKRQMIQERLKKTP